MLVGYGRVSTGSQSLEAQHETLRAAGCERLWAEKESGAKTDRAKLAKAIQGLAKGDVLVVTKLDRLARSLKDLLNTIDVITSKGAGLKVLDVPALDTTSPYGTLLLQVLGALAQFERSLIISRTSEGRARARARGVRFGRKLKLSAFQIEEAKARVAAGERLREIAATYGVSHSLISRLEP